MKYQTQNAVENPISVSIQKLVFVLLMAMMMVGCSVTTNRTITATHWGAQQGGPSTAQRVQKPTPQPDAAPQPEGVPMGEYADESAAGVEAEGTNHVPTASAERTQTAHNMSAAANGTDMTLYIGYIETVSASDALSKNGEPIVESHVRFCNLKPDASLVCAESPELNKMLNPHRH